MLLKPVASHASTHITHDGYTLTLKEWSNLLNIPYDTLRMRYVRGLAGDDLFKQVRVRDQLSPIGPHAFRIEHNGRLFSLADWAKELDIPILTLYTRYRQGLRGDELFASVS